MKKGFYCVFVLGESADIVIEFGDFLDRFKWKLGRVCMSVWAESRDGEDCNQV